MAWWDELIGNRTATQQPPVLPPALPGQPQRLPPPTTSPLSDVTNSPIFQLGLPLAASIATAIAPRRLGPAIGAGLQGLNTANYYSQLNQQRQELAKQEQEKKDLGIKLGEMLKSTKSVPGESQLVPPAPFEDQPTEGPSNLVPTQKQVPLIPDSQHKLIAQSLLDANQPTAALKFLEPEKPILQPETSNLVSPTGEMIRPASGPGLPKSGDAIYAAAAIKEHPDNPQAQAEYIRQMRNNPAGYINQIFSKTLTETGDVNQAIAAVQQVQKNTSQLRSQGTVQGQLDIRSGVPYQANEQELSRLRGVGSATGAAQATQQQPLPPAQAGALGVPYGTTGAGAAGRPVLTDAARNTITNMGTARSVLAQMQPLVEKVLTAKTPGERAMQTPGAISGIVTQSNPDAVMLHSLGEGMLAAFSRSVGQERGNTSEGDVNRARKLVPIAYPVPDTAEVALGKLKQMEALINEIEARAGGSGTDQPTPAATPPRPATRPRPAAGGGKPGGIPKIISIEKIP